MKRLLVIGLTLFISQIGLAANVQLNLPPFDETIAVSDLTLTQVQAKIHCKFYDAKKNKTEIRERYILTSLDRIEEGRYRIRMGQAVLNVWVPERELIGCGYQLITMAEDLQGNALIGDINLLENTLVDDDLAQVIRKRLATIVVGKMGDFDKAQIVDITQ